MLYFFLWIYVDLAAGNFEKVVMTSIRNHLFITIYLQAYIPLS